MCWGRGVEHLKNWPWEKAGGSLTCLQGRGSEHFLLGICFIVDTERGFRSKRTWVIIQPSS